MKKICMFGLVLLFTCMVGCQKQTQEKIDTSDESGYIQNYIHTYSAHEENGELTFGIENKSNQSITGMEGLDMDIADDASKEMQHVHANLAELAAGDDTTIQQTAKFVPEHVYDVQMFVVYKENRYLVGNVQIKAH